MSFSAIIPLTDAPAANAALEAAGYGDGNFSVLLKDAAGNVHLGLNMLPENAAFLTAVKALPNVAVSEVPAGQVGFWQQATAQNLERAVAADLPPWRADATYKHGDIVQHQGRAWTGMADVGTGSEPDDAYDDTTGHWRPL